MRGVAHDKEEIPYMRSRRRIALLLAAAGALGVGLIAFPTSAAAAPPVVPTCTPKPSTGSDSCVRGRVQALNAPLGGTLENIRLGTRVRSIFQPATDESTKVIVRYDDDGRINLTGIPTCPSSELVDKDIREAWEQCGPGADSTPASEGNAYLSTGLGAQVSGIGSTIPNGGGATACTMIFKGAANNRITLYARAPFASTNAAACDNPATNTGGSATVLFTGTITQAPASSPYGPVLTVPNTHVANPALDDFYATVQRGSAFRSRCPAGGVLRIQAVFDYTQTATDTISPPYAGTTQSC
jgi:hypothetical protein